MSASAAQRPSELEATGARSRSWGVRAGQAAIRLYQVTVAPVLGPACRYEPSCSRFAAEALERHGLARGAWLAVRRVGRCHPLGGHGYDPVP